MTRKRNRSIKSSVQPTRPISGQKYTLQRRDIEGAFRKVSTYDRVVSPDEVLKEHGNGYYVLRLTKPRFKTVWTRRFGSDESKQLQEIEKKSRYLTYGLVAVGGVEVVGFGLSGWAIWGLRKRVAQIEAVLRSLKPFGLSCMNCGKQLDYFLQEFCGQCGSALKWPEKYLPSASTSPCLQCGYGLQSNDLFCPACGLPRPIQFPRMFLPATTPDQPISREFSRAQKETL